MTANYKKIVMRQLCEITSSKRIFAADYQTEGVPFYRGKEITEKYHGKLFASTELFIARNKFDEIRTKFGVPKSGDLLLTSVGTLGSTYVVRPSDEFYFKDGNITWFRNFNKLSSTFLHYWLQSPKGIQEIKKCTIGSSQPALTIVLLKEMEIELPPFEIQCRIAAILAAYDDLIENNYRRIAILEEMARKIYQEWFVHYRFPGHEFVPLVESERGPVPEGWEPITLGQLAYETRDSVHPNAVPSDTPYVGLEHIPRRSLALGEWGIAEDVQSTKLRFSKGDILFGKIRPYFHKVVVAPVSGVASSDAIVIRARVSSNFSLVLSIVSSDAFVAHATQSSNGTKMPRANWAVLVQYPVTLPPPDLLEKFNSFITPALAQIMTLTLKNRNLRQTRDLLLPRLISGELDVSTLPMPEDMAA